MSAVLTLDPFTIDPSEVSRIGLYFPAKAEALGVLMKCHGQDTPVAVVRHQLSAEFEWRLVYGLHRLRGALAAGIDIKAIEVSGGAEELRAMQARENMHRRELEPLERAMFVAAVAEAVRSRVLAEHGVDSQQALAAKAKARAGKTQYSDDEKAEQEGEAAVDNLSTAYGWKAETAQSLGLGLKDIQRSMRIYRCIVEPFSGDIDALKDHPVAKVADSLLKIAAIKDVAKRQYVLQALNAGATTLADALQSAGVTEVKAAPEAYAKFSSQILGGWSRLGTGDKRRFIPELAAAIPAGMRSLLREELDRLEAKS